jgi:hypothetical protein
MNGKFNYVRKYNNTRTARPRERGDVNLKTMGTPESVQSGRTTTGTDVSRTNGGKGIGSGIIGQPAVVKEAPVGTPNTNNTYRNGELQEKK